MGTKINAAQHRILAGFVLLVAVSTAGCSQQQPPPQTPTQLQQSADNYANYMKSHPHMNASGQSQQQQNAQNYANYMQSHGQPGGQ